MEKEAKKQSYETSTETELENEEVQKRVATYGRGFRQKIRIR
jgi:ABC-type Na+ transport system ATPase subunit NatA